MHFPSSSFKGLEDILKRLLQKVGYRKRIIVGIGGAQDSRKSTLARRLHQRLSELKRNSIVLSLDDFYLSANERSRANLKLIRTRGAPGTHDIALLNRMLDKLLTQTETDLEWPLFSKRQYDRLSGHRGMVRWLQPSVRSHVFNIFPGIHYWEPRSLESAHYGL